ncbi:hypothetical protein D3C76_1539690 [compost metagenome]
MPLAVKLKILTVLTVVEQHAPIVGKDGECQRIIVLLSALAVVQHLLGFWQAAHLLISQQIPQIGGRQPFGKQHLLGVEYFVDIVARHHPRHHAGGTPGQQCQQAEDQDQPQPQTQ